MRRSIVENAVLEFMSCRVRVSTSEQLATAFSLSARALKRLVLAGYLRELNSFARRPSLGTQLQAAWNGGELPDAGALSYALRVRWGNSPTTQVRVFAATTKACTLFGAPTPRLKTHQIGHDLALCDVAIAYRESNPTQAAMWCGEDTMAHTRCGLGEKLPDAFIVDSSEVTKVIELCSGYPRKRLHEFMDDCANRDLPFEIWG